MVNVLLQKIRELEKELQKVKLNNDEAKEMILELFKECKVEKDKKNMFKKNLLKAFEKMEIKDIKSFYDSNNSLKYASFLEIASHINNGYLVILDANFSSEKQKFVLGFLINKISPFFTLINNKIIGMLDIDQLKEMKLLTKIPFFNSETGEFSEIDVFKIVFNTEIFDVNTIEKAKMIFEEFRKRPSYKNKHYIEYSMIKEKVVDFEQEELNKQKQRFSYIYDEKYPNLEAVLKREVKNIPFVLALLERIDSEIDKIKESKGIENIVNRMLNFIEMNLPEEGVLEEVKFLRRSLGA